MRRFTTASAEDVRWSSHARQKARSRGVLYDEVLACLAAPEVVRQGRGGMAVYTRGPLACVLACTDAPEPVLVTVLLKDEGTWTDADARRKFAEARAAAV